MVLGKIMSTLTPTQLFLKFFTTEMEGEQMQSKGMSGHSHGLVTVYFGL